MASAPSSTTAAAAPAPVPAPAPAAPRPSTDGTATPATGADPTPTPTAGSSAVPSPSPAVAADGGAKKKRRVELKHLSVSPFISLWRPPSRRRPLGSLLTPPSSHPLRISGAHSNDRTPSPPSSARPRPRGIVDDAPHRASLRPFVSFSFGDPPPPTPSGRPALYHHEPRPLCAPWPDCTGSDRTWTALRDAPPSTEATTTAGWPASDVVEAREKRKGGLRTARSLLEKAAPDRRLQPRTCTLPWTLPPSPVPR